MFSSLQDKYCTQQNFAFSGENSQSARLCATYLVQPVFVGFRVVTSCIPAVPWARFHEGDLERIMLLLWDWTQQSLDLRVKASSKVKRTFWWWRNPHNLSVGFLWSFPVQSWITKVTCYDIVRQRHNCVFIWTRRGKLWVLIFSFWQQRFLHGQRYIYCLWQQFIFKVLWTQWLISSVIRQ